VIVLLSLFLLRHDGHPLSSRTANKRHAKQKIVIFYVFFNFLIKNQGQSKKKYYLCMLYFNREIKNLINY